jgi:hypothetical protein
MNPEIYKPGDENNPDEDLIEKTHKVRVWIPQAIGVVLLVWAIYPDNPSGYYTFLRLICCWVFFYLGALSWKNEIGIFHWPSFLLAILYNPIIPVYLNREFWFVINLLSASYLIFLIFIMKVDPDDSLW